MTREWKPGDAAVVKCDDLVCPMLEHKALLGKSGRWYLLEIGEYWEEHGAEPVRPLVVIDPEDREQVERLTQTYLRDYDGVDTVAQVGEVDSMQAALRSLVAPPKPEEPTGRYAVVEDSEGIEWCRIDSVIGAFCWQRLGQPGRAETSYAKWSGINAVRVLSKGVEVQS